LISEQQAGIPLWMTALSGNSNDKTAFREMIENHLNQLKARVGLELIVADSALYTAKTLEQLGPFPWVTRVPENVGGVSQLCGTLAMRWMDSRPERAVVPLCSTYGGIRQRWLVVYTRAAHERAEQTVNRSLLKQTQAEYQAFSALSQHTYACEADASTALAQFAKKQRVTELHDTQIVSIKRFARKGRPSKDESPQIVGYRIEGHLASVIACRQQQIAPKCCFILASNELDETRLSNDALIEAYTPGQQVVERGFRFMKDPWFMANTVFLKSPKRITALMMIMTLCLLVYSALEYRIRQSLATRQATFPAQQGKPTNKPTARWVFRFFTGIHVLVLSTPQTRVLNCNEHHQRLLEALGPSYVALYADSG
jgi:transposase